MGSILKAWGACFCITVALAAQAQRPRKPAMTRAVQPSAPAVAEDVQPLDWRFAHPDAVLLISLRVGALLESPFILGLPDQLVRAGVPGVTQQQINRIWDLFSGIESIAVSVAQRAGKKQPDGLVLLTGRFESGGLLPMLRQQGGMLKSISLNPTTVLLGEGRDLEAAARRLQEHAPANPLVRSARRLSAEHDIWLAGDAGAIASASGEAPPEVRQIAEDVSSVSLGMSFEENANVQLTVAASSAEAAKRLLVRMQGLRKSQNAEVEQEGNEIRVRVSGAPESFSADLASLASTMRSETPQAAPRRAEPKPARNTIIIHGLEGGPREIVVK